MNRIIVAGLMVLIGIILLFGPVAVFKFVFPEDSPAPPPPGPIIEERAERARERVEIERKIIILRQNLNLREQRSGYPDWKAGC